jgi:hypothetical protein
MDAINRFSGFRSISATHETETRAEQPAVQTSNAGIGNTSDSFEMVQPITVDLTSLTTPMTNGDPENPTPAQSETIDPSSLLELIGTDMGTLPATATDQIQEELDGQGVVDWDAISVLKAEMAKSNPDEVAMMEILQKLKPDDLAATLASLESRGNPSDLKSMLHQIFTNGEAFTKLPGILISLATDKHLPGSQSKLLDKIMSMIAIEKNGSTVVRDMIWKTRGQGILQKLSMESLTSMYQSLRSQSGPRLLNTLYENALFQETQRQPIEGLRNLDNTPLDDSTAKAMRDFPEWGINRMNELIRDGQLDTFTRNLKTGSVMDESAFLAQFCRYGKKTENILTEYLKSYQRSHKVGAAPNDLIRSITENLGQTAVSTLSQFSPALLTDMKGILLAGNATDLEVLSKVIEPALNAAIKREAVTDAVKQSVQDFNSNILF